MPTPYNALATSRPAINLATVLFLSEFTEVAITLKESIHEEHVQVASDIFVSMRGLMNRS
jgi:hypothetical protein